MGYARTGSAHHNWKGGRTVNKKTGYVSISVNGKTKMEHRHMMEVHLGRPLLRSEQVHHKDEIKSHNELSNFELKSPIAHARHHLKHFISDTHKECTKCHKTKPHSEFPKRNDKPIGIQARCKDCFKLYENNRPSTPNPTRKSLSDKEIDSVKQMLSAKDKAQWEIALIFGVSRRQIWKINTGRVS